MGDTFGDRIPYGQWMHPERHQVPEPSKDEKMLQRIALYIPWNWTMPKDKPCPICEEDGKVIESRTDYELGTIHEVLRCRYCDHNFEDRHGKLGSR